MKTYGLIGLLLLTGMALSPVRLGAQPDHLFDYSKTPTETPTPGTASLDQAQTACLQSARSVTQTCDCLEASRAAWQAELDKALAGLRTALTGTAGAAALERAQTDWTRYRDSQLAYVDSVAAANPGAAAKACAVRTALVAARARELEALSDRRP